jgi:hypothetical protein
VLLAAGITLVVSAPLLVLVHELGHAAVGLWTTEGLVQVHVGREPARVRFRVGRLDVGLNPDLPRRGRAGVARTWAAMERGDRIAYALAGPLAELAVAFVVTAGVVGGLVPRMLVLTAGCAAFDAVANLVPRERHGNRSDGLLVLDALRGRPTAGLDDTATRFLASVTHKRHPARTDERAANLALAPQALGLAPRTAEADSAFELAAAGWFWREAEDVSLGPVAAGLARAGRSAVECGTPPARLPGMIAWEYLRSDGDPAAASREGFDDITRGLELARRVTHATLDRERARNAFLFGVAVHDAERMVAG